MTAFCRELDVAMARVKLALDDAARFKLPATNPAYVQAKAFYDSETGFWDTTYIAWGSACTNLTEEANQAAARLNAQIEMSGGETSPPYRPDQKPSGSLDAIPGWAWPIIIVAGLGSVAYISGSISNTVSVFAPRRQLRGTNSKRRRRRRLK